MRKPEEMLNYKQVMERTGLSRTKVYDLFERGELTGYRADGRRVFFASGVDAYIERNRNAAPAPAPPPPAAPRRRRPPRPAGSRVTGLKFLSAARSSGG